MRPPHSTQRRERSASARLYGPSTAVPLRGPRQRMTAAIRARRTGLPRQEPPCAVSAQPHRTGQCPPVPAQMWRGSVAAKSRSGCGRGEPCRCPSPRVGVGGVSPFSPGADGRGRAGVTPIAAGAMEVLRLGNRFPNVGACWHLCCARCAASRVLRVARLRDVRARVMRSLSVGSLASRRQMSLAHGPSSRRCQPRRRWWEESFRPRFHRRRGTGSCRTSRRRRTETSAPIRSSVCTRANIRLTAHGASEVLRELLPAIELARRISL